MPKLSAFITPYQRLKDFYRHYERLLIPATLIVGFLVDYITFKSVRINIVLTLLLTYLVVAGAGIAFIHLFDAQKLSQKFRYVRLFAPLVVQFTFGALLGGSFVFYWFSGALSVSWPFIGLLALLMVSNEVFRHYFLKPGIQISVYFFITFSLFALTLPFFFNSLDPSLFILAGVLSLVFIYLYLKILSLIKSDLKQYRRSLLASVLAIFLVMNLLYFFNFIPPIPLSLREAGLYHSIRATGSSYILQSEVETFWQKITPGQILHLGPGERAYVFTSIFAPTDLRTTIYHHWQYYDPEKKTWLSKDKLSFGISGGRQEGYRGYSSKSALTPGTWRVYVETERGQVLGRIKFNVEKVSERPQLIEVRK